MPGTVLYSSTVPVGGAAGQKLNDATAEARAQYGKFAYLPYIVSGPYSKTDSSSLTQLVPAIGAFIHVALWIAGFVVDGMLGSELTPHTNTDFASTVADDFNHTLWLYSLILFVFAFVALLGIIVQHLMTKGGIAEGRAPPYLVTIISGGCVVGAIFSFLLLQASPSTLAKHTQPNKTAAETLDFEARYFHLAIWSCLIKTYIASFVMNNQFWARAAPM